MRLQAYLAQLPDDKLLADTPSGKWTVSRVLKNYASLSQAVAGKRVAIQLSDPGVGLRALAVLDGVAASITLLSPSLPVEYLPTLLRLAQCDTLITDTVEQTDDLPVADIYNHPDQLSYPDSPLTELQGFTAWHLATSGTTGVPKLVSHSLASLVRTTKFRPPGGEEPRWGLLYDYTRFAGLQVLLQAVLAGSQLIAPPLDAPLRTKITHLGAAGCTHLSATPTMWRKIAMTPEARSLPLRQITLGGEIADDRILTSLAALYPSARIIHIYASTEAGVGFSVKDRRSGFPATYLDNPPDGIALRIENGRLFLKNTAVRTNYVGTDVGFGSEDGWIDTGDNVTFDDHRVQFLGRASGLINVGGDKVHPEEVEAILMAHPAVHAARVFGRASSIMGTVVAAEVVPTTPPVDVTALRRELKTFVGTHLTPAKVPAIINFVEDLALNATGKVSRDVL
jgi:acyl-CoA synthetase (AMP-forming)/AMP-acid ligase II